MKLYGSGLANLLMSFLNSRESALQTPRDQGFVIEAEDSSTNLS